MLIREKLGMPFIFCKAMRNEHCQLQMNTGGWRLCLIFQSGKGCRQWKRACAIIPTRDTYYTGCQEED